MQDQTIEIKVANNRKKGLFDEYFDYFKYYQGIYGPKAVVLFEVGAFYCMYGVNNEVTKINSDIVKITELLNVTLTRADKSIVENSLTNPLMCGIPSHEHVLRKYMKILIGDGYTVILITQTGNGTRAGKMCRRVKKIYSPSTYIDNDILDQVDSNYLMGLYFDTNNYGGVCIIDLSTGSIIIYEPKGDTGTECGSSIRSEVLRFKKSYNPKECFICYNESTFGNGVKDLVNYLEFNEFKNYYIKPIAKRDEIWSIKFQNEFLLRVYPKHQFMSPIEYIDLEKYPISVITLIKTIQFAYEHDDRIVFRLEKPSIVNQNNYLILEDNAIDQLNLISEKNEGKYSSLLNIIDHTKTAPGRRKLKAHFIAPIVDPIELQKRYTLVETLVNTCDTNGVAVLESIEKELSKGLIDLERRHRKMTLGILDPSDLYKLYQSYVCTCNVLDIAVGVLPNICPDKDTLNKFTKFIKDIKSKINLHEIQKYHFDSIKGSFLIKGVDKIVDSLDAQLLKYTNALESRRLFLSKIINDFKDPTGSVQLEFNERDTWHFKLTNTRFDKLKKKLQETGQLKELEKYTISKNKTTIKLTSKALRDLSDKITGIQSRLELRIKKVYTDLLLEWSENYSDTLKKITDFVADIDVIQSHARTSIKYGYTKPILDPTPNFSYFDAKELRNPLVERLNTKTAFVPNDISLNCEGMLLFSVNGCGKSTLLRSIAMNIIMAQIGGFVPCSFFKFSPFKNILTRIGNQDNIFKGQSTFQIEMLELRVILNKSTPKSLVITDELCSGTENSSATTILGSTIIELAERKVNFVFATHLHNLNNIESITSLKNVKIFHLKVDHHPKTNELVYNRKLSEGPGDSIYGLEIAKVILQNPNFIKRAMKMRKEILNLKSTIVSKKRSRYNKNVFVSKCEICSGESNLEVHHIKFQCTANLTTKLIGGNLHVHSESNLVVLCTHCHCNVHLGNITVNGWKEGVESGRFLSYQLNLPKDQLIKKNI